MGTPASDAGARMCLHERRLGEWGGWGQAGAVGDARTSQTKLSDRAALLGPAP